MGNTCASLDAVPPDPINPHTIDLTHYEQLKILGKGGQGTVSVCRNRINNEIVAVKCVSKYALLKHTTFLYTLFNERNLLIMNAQYHQQSNTDNHTAQAAQSFLCNVYCTFQSATHVYMVLPYLSGGDIRYHLTDKSQFTEHVTQFYAAELLISLMDLHSRNILYRDLKPENILLNKSGYTVLCDFGLAGELKKSTEYTTYGRSGTASYFSPELICDLSYSFEIDYWCYGILLYELMHGRRPIRISTINNLMQLNRSKLTELYYNVDQQHTLRKELNDNIHYRSNLTADCIDLIKGLLSVDRTTRYGSNTHHIYNNGWLSIQQHPWFRDIDWIKIRQRRYKPPIRPRRDIINANMKFELEYQLIDSSNINEIKQISDKKQKYFQNWNWNDVVQQTHYSTHYSNINNTVVNSNTTPQSTIQSVDTQHDLRAAQIRLHSMDFSDGSITRKHSQSLHTTRPSTSIPSTIHNKNKISPGLQQHSSIVQESIPPTANTVHTTRPSVDLTWAS